MHTPHTFSYLSMGTTWKISIWDQLSPVLLTELEHSIVEQSQMFDRTYSRFIHSSLVWSLSRALGVVSVPKDLVSMLRIYEQLFDLTEGKVSPLIGFALSDLGYDAEYSLVPKETIRPVPNFHDAIDILDDEHIELRETVLLDLGALGKGYFVDKISYLLQERGVKRLLVDGSGDIYYQGNGESIRAGLEHPEDSTKVIGVLEMRGGSMCASGINRRKWGKYHHVLDPISLTSPEEILAVWVLAEHAAVADGLATCLFFVEPEKLQSAYSFEYCIMNRQHRVKRSKGFAAELF